MSRGNRRRVTPWIRGWCAETSSLQVETYKRVASGQAEAKQVPPSVSIDERQLSYRKKALSEHRIKVFVFRYHPKERGRTKAEVAPANLPNA
jgi:hypothetical protein